MFPHGTLPHGTMTLPMETDFPTWLSEKLDELQWTQADLARRSKLSAAQITRILSGERNPGEESLLKIANALALPPAMVFRAAGVFPPDPKIGADPLTEEGVHILYQLEKDHLQEALRQLRLRLAVQEEQGKYHAQGKKRSAAAD